MKPAKLIASIKDVGEKRHLIYQLAKSDFRKRFVGSYFGLFWMFLQPVVTILIYYFIFQVGFKAVPSSTNFPYVVWLVPGIVPWFFFSEALNQTTNCLEDYSYLVKKIVFKVSILPLIKELACLFVHVIFIGVMLVVLICMGTTPQISWIQILYYSICTFLLVLGLSFITSAIQVFFKDMAQIVAIALQLGMWATPIMYEYTMFKSAVPIMKLNPMFYIVEGYRDSMLYGTWFFEKPWETLYFWAFTIIVLVVGVLLFKRLKPHFADVL